MQQSIVKFYCFVVQTLLNMFRALQCPSSGARQTAVAASDFRMNVEAEVFSAVASSSSSSSPSLGATILCEFYPAEQFSSTLPYP
jgi:hypothetical protein